MTPIVIPHQRRFSLHGPSPLQQAEHVGPSPISDSPPDHVTVYSTTLRALEVLDSCQVHACKFWEARRFPRFVIDVLDRDIALRQSATAFGSRPPSSLDRKALAICHLTQAVASGE